MENTSKMDYLIELILNQLHEIKNHIRNDRLLEAGMEFGQLISQLKWRIDLHEDEKINEYEILDPNLDRCYRGLETRYNELKQELLEKTIIYLKTKEIIKDLIRNDYINTINLDYVITQTVMVCKEETMEGLYAIHGKK